MIIETIFSTLDAQGNPNFAPMGIEWGAESVVVRPFRSSKTFRNLAGRGLGVASLSDDVLAFVRCCLLDEILPSFPAVTIPGAVFGDACSWIELEVESRADSGPGAEFRCRITHTGRRRDFRGFSRAKNAVIESAILATRLDLLDSGAVAEDLKRYMNIVNKTGDIQEINAMQIIWEYVEKRGKA